MVKKEGDKVSSKDKSISKRAILEGIIKKADYFASRNSTTDIEMYYLVKEFFTEFLELKYEFSLDELLFELDKVYLDSNQRLEITAFINKIRNVEFKDNSFNQENTKELIREFSLIARNIAKITEQKKTGLLTKMKLLFVKEKKETVQKEKIATSIVQDSTRGLDAVTEKEFVNAQDTINDDQLDLPEYKEEYSKDLTDNLSVVQKMAQNEVNSKTTKNNSNIKQSEKGNAQKDLPKYSKYYGAKPDTKDVVKKYSPGDDWTSETKLAVKTESKTNAIQSEAYENKIYEKKQTNISEQKKDQKLGAKKISQKAEFDKLLSIAKNTNKKLDLVELYKKMHEMYDGADIDFQALYYQDLMDVYKKISTAK